MYNNTETSSYIFALLSRPTLELAKRFHAQLS